MGAKAPITSFKALDFLACVSVKNPCLRDAVRQVYSRGFWFFFTGKKNVKEQLSRFARYIPN